MEWNADLSCWLKIITVYTYDSEGNVIEYTKRYSVVHPPKDIKPDMDESEFVEVEPD